MAIAMPVNVSAKTGGALPPAAQESLDHGILAAKLPDYLLAIRYFEDARKLAPDAPIIYLNLGLAESKIPSRELRAIAWFGAYLAAYPTAPNAAAVREQIDLLVVKNESNVSHLVKAAQDAADGSAWTDRDYNLQRVSRLWATANDIASALAAEKLIKDPLYQMSSLTEIADIQAQTGDIAGAQKTLTVAVAIGPGKLGTIWTDEAKLQKETASRQAKATDFAGARQTANLIKDSFLKAQAQLMITEIQAKQSTPDTRPPLSPTVAALEWLWPLDDDRMVGSAGSWKTQPFLNLASYLKSQPTSDDPQEIFQHLYETAQTIVLAQEAVRKMLKQQGIQ